MSDSFTLPPGVTLAVRYDMIDVTAMGAPSITCIRGGPSCTLSGLPVTFDQAEELAARRDCHVSISMTRGLCAALEVTRDEAQRIARGEDPYTVLLAGPGLRLVAVIDPIFAARR